MSWISSMIFLGGLQGPSGCCGTWSFTSDVRNARFVPLRPMRMMLGWDMSFILAKWSWWMIGGWLGKPRGGETKIRPCCLQQEFAITANFAQLVSYWYSRIKIGTHPIFFAPNLFFYKRFRASQRWFGESAMLMNPWIESSKYEKVVKNPLLQDMYLETPWFVRYSTSQCLIHYPSLSPSEKKNVGITPEVWWQGLLCPV